MRWIEVLSLFNQASFLLVPFAPQRAVRVRHCLVTGIPFENCATGWFYYSMNIIEWIYTNLQFGLLQVYTHPGCEVPSITPTKPVTSLNSVDSCHTIVFVHLNRHQKMTGNFQLYHNPWNHWHRCRSPLTKMVQWLLTTYRNQVDNSYMQLSGIGGTEQMRMPPPPSKRATTIL